MYGGKPVYDAPFLWALRAEVVAASQVVLGCDEFAYLRGKFQDRNTPENTRLFYAISKLEDQAMRAFCTDLVDAFPNAHVSAYIFDGFIAVLPQAQDFDMETLQSLMGQVLEQSGVQWVASKLGEAS